MDINAIWAAVEPYVMAVLGTGIGGTIVGIICRILQSKLLRKLDVNGIADKVSAQVQKGLTGKTLNIDVTAVTEKKLDKIEIKLNKKLEQIQTETAAYKYLLTQIGVAVAHFKSLSEAEKKNLTEAIKALDNAYKPPEPEQVVTVKLEPLEIDKPDEENEEEPSLINFGGRI